VNTPTQIVARIITGVHQEFCKDNLDNCYHEIELLRLWSEDAQLTNMVKAGNKEYRNEVMDTLEKSRCKLVNPNEIEPESYAEWINSVFNLAIKAVGDMK